MAQLKKFSNLQAPQRTQRQEAQSSNVANRASRLQAEDQNQRAGNFPASNLSENDSRLGAPQRNQTAGFAQSGLSSSTSRLQASTQQPSYSSNVSGINKRSQSSFPPQKRSALPGFTNYSAIPPPPQILLAENSDLIITENNEFVNLDTPI